MLSVLMRCMGIFSLIIVLWAVYGYGFAFTEGNAFFGGLDRLFLKGSDAGFGGSHVQQGRSGAGISRPSPSRARLRRLPAR
ncbi:hypothetical protein ACU4HD_47110 [Cupriavidus basilensis]